jgi:hypothetical protein
METTLIEKVTASESATTDKSKSQAELLNELRAVAVGYIGSSCGMVSFE